MARVGWTTKDTNRTKGELVVLELSAAVLGRVSRGGGHGLARMITERVTVEMSRNG